MLVEKIGELIRVLTPITNFIVEVVPPVMTWLREKAALPNLPCTRTCPDR